MSVEPYCRAGLINLTHITHICQTDECPTFVCQLVVHHEADTTVGIITALHFVTLT